MAKTDNHGSTAERHPVLKNGNGRKARPLPSPKPTGKKKLYYATVFPNPNSGRSLPDPFVKLVKKVEESLKMPVWLLIQNGSPDYCCAQICDHALDGFQSNREAIEEGKPVALLIQSPGGDAHHAYSIARFFQRRTRDFTVLVPRYAKSAATLLALGASQLILGRDAELGPLDVQMRDREREEYGSALDAVQSLERLNVFSLAAIDQLMLLLTQRTGKRVDTLLPLVLNYSTSFVRPLLDKIDTVDYTKKSRELKVAEEYAVRLMQQNYPLKVAKQIAAHLVEQYPTHGFVIDRQEAETETTPGGTYGLGLKIRRPSAELEKIFEDMQPFLDCLSIIGKLEEIEV
jgi:hypothetical protein